MTRPSRTGSKTSGAKSRNASTAKGRKTTKTKRPITRTATRINRRSLSDPRKDLKEAREQQAAMAAILRVIASSPSDTTPVFDAIATSAKQLMGGFSAAVFRFVGDVGYLAAFTPIDLAADEAWKATFPRRLSDFLPFEWVRGGEAAQVADTETEPAVRDLGRLRGGFRSLLVAPLMSNGAPIGLVSVTRKEPGTFAAHHVQLLQTFADQAVIAIENARLFNETQEALERQTATSNVLQVISESMAETAPVFESILDSCEKLIEFNSAGIALVGGDQLQLQAARGPGTRILWSLFPQPLDSVFGEAIRAGKPIYTANVAESASATDAVRLAARKVKGYSLLQVPMAWQNRSVGSISVARLPNVGFSDKEVALLKTFAAQAVIAIENTRLFNEVQQRTEDLSEALRQQTATGEVLKVIASSPTDVKPALQAIVESACAYCNAYDAGVLLRVGDELHFSAHHGPIRSGGEPRPISRDWVVGRSVVDKVPVQVSDFQAAEAAEFPEGQRQSREQGHRCTLSVPLLREGEAIGAIALRRLEPVPFSEKQVSLLKTFADQAVIAIGNVRLFEEVQAKTRDLSEALTYQTGSANILRVIASSPTDVAPVLDAIVKSACQLCDAYDAIVRLKDGEYIRFGAHLGPIPPVLDERLAIDRSFITGRAIVDRLTIHLHDVFSAEGDEFPGAREISQHYGIRTILCAPMLREGESIGAIMLRRREVNPFTDKQIALLQTFADQAVIAIENVRLFDEVQAKTRDLSEALTYQTGSANILSVIASSPTDVQPVMNAIVKSACELCGAYDSVALLKEGDDLLFSAHHGPIPMRSQKRSINRRWTAGRAFIEKKPIHVHDLQAEWDEFPEGMEMARDMGHRSIVSVPLLREGESVGALVLRRLEVNPFSEKQIVLLQTFADQAVIAIENARLFNETQEALERQTATADILKVIASSPDDVQPVFEAIAERSNRLVNGMATAVYRRHGDMLHLMAFTPVSPEADAALQASFPAPVSLFRWDEIIERGGTYVVTDAEAEFATQPTILRISRLRGWRSTLSTLLMRDGEAIGVITVTRVEPGGFDDHEVQLLKTFADQAVIAISNVGLFKEVQARTRDLSQSLDDLRAAQDRLVQTEKLASLGQLTAGIAHEIKNPLNFINNFSALSSELALELNDLLKDAALTDKMRQEVEELTRLLTDNLQKVVQHGKRADSIVKNMLLHSREGSGEQRSADINALVDESLNLAYHGARAERPSGFNITLQRDFDASAGSAELYPQEITRALLNVISNGFYAATKRQKENGEQCFEPMLIAATRNLGSTIEIRIRDNGMGIPPEVKEKMFNPFFTTKPAGEGTGLGLSMTHDIVVKQHGGRIDVATEPGQFTEFTIVLPRAGTKH